jgi:hypothetical protein
MSAQAAEFHVVSGDIHPMCGAICVLGFVGAFGNALLSAQTYTIADLNPLSSTPGGIRLQNVTAFIGYDSLGMGSIFGSGYNPNGVVPIGVSATLAFNKFGERSSLSIVYTPSYTRIAGYSGVDTSTHSLVVNWRRSLTPRWLYNVSVSGNLTLLNESLVASSAPSGGQSTSISALATPGATAPAPAPSPAVATLFYGQRYLTTAIQNSLSYTYSARLSFHFGVSANRVQALPDGAMSASGQFGSLIARTTSGSANAGMSYSLSPFTQAGVDASTSRVFSSLADAYVSSVTASLSHNTGMHWSMQGQIGGGFINPLQQSYTARGGQYQAGGTLGYHTRMHMFSVSGNRSVSDMYGFGSSATVSSTASWTWRQPTGSWWLSSSFEQAWMMGTVYGGIDTWQVSSSFGHMIGRKMASMFRYGYGTYTGAPGSPLRQFSQHVVQLAFTWAPAAGVTN